MRLWHRDLIPYLPRKQLLGQWRECCLIAKNIAETGTPNHLLVNKIMDYPIEHFIVYSREAYHEMLARGYNCNSDCFEKHIGNFFSAGRENGNELYIRDDFPNWHDAEYFFTCLFNLNEKFLCGGIPADEWKMIQEEYCFSSIMDILKSKSVKEANT